MTGAASVFFALFFVAAVADWIAVYLGHGERRAAEYVAKPLTLVFLILATLALDPNDPTARTWFVVALVFGLVGDVFLMFPDRFFLFGLASFLVGHLAYVGGFAVHDLSAGGAVVGLAVVAGGLATIGRRIVTAVADAEPKLTTPVGAYIGVISLMVMLAMATGQPTAIVGALLFYASDALIAWNKFIEESSWGRVAIIVTYHLGQFLIVLSLL